MKKQLLMAAALTVLCPFAGTVQAQQSDSWMGDIHGTIGLRVWRTDWQSWFGGDRYVEAETETSLIPLLSLRYQEFLVSGSYLTSTDFTFSPTYKPERKEYDINFGYFLLPSLAATVGYKHMEYKDATSGY